MTLTTEATEYHVEHNFSNGAGWLPSAFGPYATEAAAHEAGCRSAGRYCVVQVTTTRQVLPNPPRAWAAGDQWCGPGGTLYHVSEILDTGDAVVWWTNRDGLRLVDFIDHRAQTSGRYQLAATR